MPLHARLPASARGRALGRAVLAGVVAVLVAGWVAGAALAHAQLISITPADNEVVATAPADVVLEFNEAVSLTGGSARVLDDQAAQVSGPPVQQDQTITVPLEAGLADGTYTVTYEVVSADSHRITGGSVFHVGAPSSGGVVVPVAGAQAGWGIRLGVLVLSTLGYAGALIAAGILALTIYADRSRPLLARPIGAADRLGYRWDATIVRAAVLGGVAMLAVTPFRIARVGGGLDALRDNDLIRTSLRGPIGLSTAVTVVALFAVAVAIDRRAPGWVGSLFAFAALVGFALEGHTRAEHEAWMVLFDVIHLAAGAVWLGGVVGLVAAFRSSPEPARLYRIVRRFSQVAVGAVVVVSAAGAVMAWVILPGVAELTSTGWGLALITKVAIVVVVIGIGSYNNRRLVPTIHEPGHDDAERSAAARRLGRIVAVEAVLLVAVVGVAAVLVTRSPVPSTAAAPLAPVGTADEVAAVTATVDLSDGGTATVSFTPGRVGTNDLEVVLRDAEDRVVNPVDVPAVELTLADLDVGPLAVELAPLGIGDYGGTIDLSFAGSWDVLVRVRTGEFDSASGSAAVEITE